MTIAEEKFKPKIHESWWELLSPLISDERFLNILSTLAKAKKFEPDINNIFKAFTYPKENVKALIVGQDPYFNKGVATGLSFANFRDYKGLSPSLDIIIQEIERTFPEWNEFTFYGRKDLQHWAEEGIMLLNSALTVEIGNPGSHQDIWRYFIEAVLADMKETPIYLLGKTAQELKTVCKEYYCYPHPAADTYDDKKLFRGCGIFEHLTKRTGFNGY